MQEPVVIAILGAECTGKSTLAAALVAALVHAGIDATLVPEYLREFCAAHGRTPHADEQRDIAREQSARIWRAGQRHAVVVADTTALMSAIYSELCFGDPGLYADAWLSQRACRLHLLTGLDVPWMADGFQRDGPAARERVDTHLRAVLLAQSLPFSVLPGAAAGRVDAALRGVRRVLAPAPPVTPAEHWRWICHHGGDGACEAATRALSR